MTTDKKLPTPPDGYTWAFEDYEGDTFTLELRKASFVCGYGKTFRAEIQAPFEAYGAAQALIVKQREDANRKETLATLRGLIP